jgi:hypothetical protein
VPSRQDADAAQYTLGVDMILGIEFSPSGPFGWYDDTDGVRRKLQVNEEKTAKTPEKRGWGRWRTAAKKTVLGVAPTGHSIHGLELISFHRSGTAVNVVFVDEEGYPYGWENFQSTT